MSKICNVCHFERDESNFYSRELICKPCGLIRQKNYRKKTNNSNTKIYEKTFKGFLVRTYRNMKSRVTGIQKKKAHIYLGLEILSKEEFYKFSINNEAYKNLYINWKQKEHNRKLTPSINRINPDLVYILDNIEWITHSDNSKFTRRWS